MSSDKSSREQFIAIRPEQDKLLLPEYPLLSVRELEASPKKLDAHLRSQVPEQIRRGLRPEEKVVRIRVYENIMPDKPISSEEVIRRARAMGRRLHGSTVASVSMNENDDATSFPYEHGRDAETVALDLADDDPQLLDDTNISLAARQGVNDEQYIEGEPFGFEKPGAIPLVVMDPSNKTAQKFAEFLKWKPVFYASADGPAIFILGCVAGYQKDPSYFIKHDYNSRAGYSTTLSEAFYLSCKWMLESRNHEGLIEYFNPVKDGGMRNQGWRDGAGAMVHAGGGWANSDSGVVSTEIQAISQAAMNLAAPIFSEVFKNDSVANALYEGAWTIKKFYREHGLANSAEGGYVPLGFDYGDNGRLRPMNVKTTMPDVLKHGLLSDDQAIEYITTLANPDIVTKWGARSMSANEVAYGPFRYHEGKIWPHINYALGAGVSRYGFYELDRYLGSLTDEAIDLLGFPPETIWGENSEVPTLSAQDIYVYNELYDEVYLADRKADPQTWAASAQIAAHRRFRMTPGGSADPRLRTIEENAIKKLQRAHSF